MHNLNVTNTESSAENVLLTPLERNINNKNEESNNVVIGENNDWGINRSHGLFQSNEQTTTALHPLDEGGSNDTPFRPTRSEDSRKCNVTF